MFTLDFTTDGKVTLVAMTADGKTKTGEGTYKVDGNKLTATVKVGDNEQSITRTISKLTDTELVATDERGHERALVRIKNK